jgi:glycosyltransferase involved in cell wall biosynthesis
MAEGLKFYLYCRHNNVEIRNELGMPDYSYKFVEQYFQRNLVQHGEVIEVSSVSELPDVFAENEYLLVFAPPHEVPQRHINSAIPVFAWEYSTIPNEALNDNELWNWQTVLRSARGAITHSSFSIESMDAAEIDIPKIALLSPLYDNFSHLGFQEKPKIWTIDCEGLVWDSSAKSVSSLITFDEVTYTYLFNPVDGRKRWEEAVSGFVWAHRNNHGATLILKLIHKDQQKSMGLVREYIQQLGEFDCRVVVICGYLSDANYQQLILGTSFTLNTSCGEGQCLPLIEFMSAGVPAISPRHTAMIDYINDENSFVIEHSWSWVPWPNDPLLRFRCSNYPINWESLRDAFVASFDVALNKQEIYRRMSTSARETMFEICSESSFERKFLEFLKHL